jgi:hypothetical protein
VAKLEISKVHDAYRQGVECPLCFLQASAEKALLTSLQHSRAMQPDVRVRTNREGFCPEHLRRLYAGENKLGLALTAHTRLQHVIAEAAAALEDAARAAGGRDARPAAGRAAARLSALGATCYVCGLLLQDSQRYRFTILYLWSKDPEFPAVFRASRGFCIPHFAAMTDEAARSLRPDRLRSWLAESGALLHGSLESLEKDLHSFTQLHQADNRSPGTEAERTALVRTLQKLAGGEYSAG